MSARLINNGQCGHDTGVRWKVGRFVRVWANHAALNTGAGLRCLFHIALPPQVDHSRDTVESLASSDIVTEFLRGLGVIEI